MQMCLKYLDSNSCNKAFQTISQIISQEYKKFTFVNDNNKLIFTDVRYKFGIYKYILSFSNESSIYDLDTFYKFTFTMNPIRRKKLVIQFFGA